MDEEYVLTGTDLVFARLSATGAPWPALSFTATPKAEEQLRSYSKFFEGGKIVNYPLHVLETY